MKRKYNSNRDGENLFLAILILVLCTVLMIICIAKLASRKEEEAPRAVSEYKVIITEYNYEPPVEDTPIEQNIEIPKEEQPWEEGFREEIAAQVDVTPTVIHLGRFQLTVYTPESDGGKWGYQTATGVRSQHLATCAVDPTVIPYGTTVIVGGENGLRLKAVDCGSGVKGKQIDIFYDGTERQALIWLMEEFGDYAEVYREEVKP